MTEQTTNSGSSAPADCGGSPPAAAAPLVMRDQATELRNLVLRSARQRLDQAGPAPQLIAVAGGKPGVGATTLAVNLAIALADQGSRVVLVDADLEQAEVAKICGIRPRQNIVDLLQTRRDIHEVLERGPGGIQIVPGPAAETTLNAAALATAQQRLLAQLKSLGRYADLVLLDIGSCSTPWTARVWQAADQILLVTTPDLASVMETYANLKTQLQSAKASKLHLIVNQADRLEMATDVHRRVDQSSQRFLGVAITWLGYVPGDAQVPLAAQQAIPLVLSSAAAPAAQAITRIALQLSGTAQQSPGSTQAVA